LLLDEPTSAMDAQTEALFLEHLKRATEGQALVVVTHRPSLLALVDRIVVVDDGKIVADGPKAEILAKLSGKPEAPAAQSPRRRSPPADTDRPISATKPAPTFDVGKSTKVCDKHLEAPAPAAVQGMTS